MNKKTLTKLEFYKITELLMNEATTPGGQRRLSPCRKRPPLHLPALLKKDICLSVDAIRSKNL